MLNNKNLKLISIIKTYINNDPKLHVKFNHYNRKYTIDELLPYMCNIIYERYLLAKDYLTKFNDYYSLKLNNSCLPKDTFQTLTNTYYRNIRRWYII